MKLKSCPFCGGEAKVYNGQVVCTKCWSGSACEDTTEKAIEIWNTRKPMDRIVEQLEEQKTPNKSMSKTESILRRRNFEDAIEIVKKGGSV